MSAEHLNAETLQTLERKALLVMTEAAQLALSFFRRSLTAVQKADGSLVSDADKSIESRVRELLADVTPEFGFVGEEFGALARLGDHMSAGSTLQTQNRSSSGEGLLEFEMDLNDRPQSTLNLDQDTYWILDPIDGTINFLSHIPQWSTLLALVQNGRPVLGIVALPALDEVFVASLGNGSRHGRLFQDFTGKMHPVLQACKVGNTKMLSDAHVSYSTAKTFAYRGIDSFLPVLQSVSKECRTHSDAFGYTRILTGGIDVMVDPLVAPYDVAALQILFDETPDAVFTTLHGHRGANRFRMGSVVAAAHPVLADEFLSTYRNHLIETAEHCRRSGEVLGEPLKPESFSPTFEVPFETEQTKYPAKIWARALETAVAEFMSEQPTAHLEDISILLGTRESAQRAFSNGRNEGPPSFTSSCNYHIRAVVSGSAGLSTGTPDAGTDPVATIFSALNSAWVQRTKLGAGAESEILASRPQIIAHVGQHPWRSLRFADDFVAVSEMIREQHLSKHDERVHSVKSRLNMSAEYRWQYFLDSAQQTYVTQVCRISTNVTCSEDAEKRTAYARYLKNHIPKSDELMRELSMHFRKAESQSLALLPAALVPENPEYDYLAVDADLLGLILHEAVGHAAEGDLIQTRASGFGKDGRMMDLQVGPDWLDIVIDGSLDNCGYLPVDAEGVLPSRKLLVSRGRLVDAIHTRHTAKLAGKTPDGCARVQSLQYPSLNRMTSIWVAPTQSRPLGTTNTDVNWDDIGPEVIQQALEQQGYLNGEHGVLLLSGWKGGTASCSNLEFRADVARVLHLKKGCNPTLMREANFTGIATECFRSAVDAFGPTICRSIGTCGKDGQGVLTSDGGPAFMVFKPNTKVRVIGTGDGEVEDS
jgi:fructose-1,6-bisphosphatase/inositol monophosphatase family enzyme/predicted Zn-dependent protease